MNPGSWIEGLFCSDYVSRDYCYLLKLMLGLSSGLSHHHLSGPKDMMIQDVRLRFYPKGAIASEKQGDVVRVFVCM